MAELFTEIFNYLPLCHVINKKIFVSAFLKIKFMWIASGVVSKNFSKGGKRGMEGVIWDLRFSLRKDKIFRIIG